MVWISWIIAGFDYLASQVTDVINNKTKLIYFDIKGYTAAYIQFWGKSLKKESEISGEINTGKRKADSLIRTLYGESHWMFCC